MVGPHTSVCPKCDALLGEQTDGSVRTHDIAHYRQTVEQALRQMEQTINQEKAGYTQAIRFIVGRGLIRDAVKRRLSQLHSAKLIRRFGQDGENEGALLVELRKPAR